MRNDGQARVRASVNCLRGWGAHGPVNHQTCSPIMDVVLSSGGAQIPSSGVDGAAAPPSVLGWDGGVEDRARATLPRLRFQEASRRLRQPD